MNTVNIALHAKQAHIAVCDTLLYAGHVGLGILQLLLVLLKAQTGSLLLELEFSDALAQGLKLALELHAAFVTGTQLRGQVIVFAALGAQRLFTLQLECQRVLQASLRCGIGQTR